MALRQIREMGDEVLTKVSKVVNSALDSVSGYFTSRNRSLNATIQRIDDNIARQNNAVEKYRMSQEEERRAGVIIGNFKTFEYNSTTAERIVNAPVTDFTQNDFPPDIDYPSMDNRF